jgi:hypothetical protein
MTSGGSPWPAPTSGPTSVTLTRAPAELGITHWSSRLLGNWTWKSSRWPVTFGLPYGAIEMMTTGAPCYDLARFGPQRSPLGGIPVEYKGAEISRPDQRKACSR